MKGGADPQRGDDPREGGPGSSSGATQGESADAPKPEGRGKGAEKGYPADTPWAKPHAQRPREGGGGARSECGLERPRGGGGGEGGRTTRGDGCRVAMRAPWTTVGGRRAANGARAASRDASPTKGASAARGRPTFAAPARRSWPARGPASRRRHLVSACRACFHTPLPALRPPPAPLRTPSRLACARPPFFHSSLFCFF